MISTADDAMYHIRKLVAPEVMPSSVKSPFLPFSHLSLRLSPSHDHSAGQSTVSHPLLAQAAAVPLVSLSHAASAGPFVLGGVLPVWLPFLPSGVQAPAVTQ